MRIDVIGAGLTGLIYAAANPNCHIYESEKSLPNAHGAVLRFRTDEISKLLKIPFKKVEVTKGIWMNGDVVLSPRINNLYSRKVLGKIRNRSIMNLDVSTRYIAPGNFINQLAERCNIDYGSSLKKITKDELFFTDGTQLMRRKGHPIVSTIPMDILAKITGYDSKKISIPVSTRIYTFKAYIDDCDCYSTIYYPELNKGVYRASITGNMLLIESSWPTLSSLELMAVFESFGLDGADVTNVKPTKQGSGKIGEMNSLQRKAFIYHQTVENNIYSLGRYGTWRPKLLLDDLAKDIDIINDIIRDGQYAARLHKQDQ